MRALKYNYMGRTGAYASLDMEPAHRLLVSRVESISATENVKWQSRQQQIEDAEYSKTMSATKLRNKKNETKEK